MGFKDVKNKIYIPEIVEVKKCTRCYTHMIMSYEGCPYCQTDKYIEIVKHPNHKRVEPKSYVDLTEYNRVDLPENPNREEFDDYLKRSKKRNKEIARDLINRFNKDLNLNLSDEDLEELTELSVNISDTMMVSGYELQKQKKLNVSHETEEEKKNE